MANIGIQNEIIFWGLVAITLAIMLIAIINKKNGKGA